MFGQMLVAVVLIFAIKHMESSLMHFVVLCFYTNDCVICGRMGIFPKTVPAAVDQIDELFSQNCEENLVSKQRNNRIVQWSM